MSKVVDLLGDKTSYYLDHTCKTIDKSLIYIPSPGLKMLLLLPS